MKMMFSCWNIEKSASLVMIVEVNYKRRFVWVVFIPFQWSFNVYPTSLPDFIYMSAFKRIWTAIDYRIEMNIATDEKSFLYFLALSLIIQSKKFISDLQTAHL